MRSILEKAEANYDVPFDNDCWRLERATVKTGEKTLAPLVDRRPSRSHAHQVLSEILVTVSQIE